MNAHLPVFDRKTFWKNIRDRLHTLQQTLEKGRVHSRDYESIILKQRAEILAQPLQLDERTGDCLDLTVFTLANEHYAIETRFITEVLRLKTYISIPGSLPHIPGVIHYRGRILTLLDLKKYFQLTGKGFYDMKYIMLVQIQKKELGVLADTVIGNQSKPIASIQNEITYCSEKLKKYIRGVTDDQIAILDGKMLLTDETLLSR